MWRGSGGCSLAEILLGVSGSVACYRACDLARDLMRAGHSVTVCLTDAAQNFVSAALFEALTGRPCLTSAFEEPERGRMAHIDIARRADLVLVAPATANTLNKLAHGFADDMLTTAVLASAAPLVVAPAMNPQMFAAEPTSAALDQLRSRATVVEPAEGDVACGESGQGKLAANAEILGVVEVVLADADLLAGMHVVLTCGPTQEPIDSVRFVSNRSSGKMGAALARAALSMGAKVTVVHGPVSVALPAGAGLVPVVTAAEMLDRTLEVAPNADIFIAAAAVADFRPASPVEGKIRSSEELHIDFLRNQDVAQESAKVVKPGCVVVAFAAEPDSGVDAAKQKMIRKGAHAIAVNDISRTDVGFESDFNELTLLTRTGTSRSERASKLVCAKWLLRAAHALHTELRAEAR